MNKAIITLCRALAQVIAAHYHTFDGPTSDLMVALKHYVESNEK